MCEVRHSAENRVIEPLWKSCVLSTFAPRNEYDDDDDDDKVCVLVYKCLHQHTSLNCAHRCLNQPIIVTSVPLHVVTL